MLMLRVTRAGTRTVLPLIQQETVTETFLKCYAHICVLEQGNEELNRVIDVSDVPFRTEVLPFTDFQGTPLSKPAAHHVLGGVLCSCESSPAGHGTQYTSSACTDAGEKLKNIFPQESIYPFRLLWSSIDVVL